MSMENVEQQLGNIEDLLGRLDKKLEEQNPQALREDLAEMIRQAKEAVAATKTVRSPALTTFAGPVGDFGDTPLFQSEEIDP